MAEVERARAVLDAERRAVLDDLAQAAEDRRGEHARHAAALAALQERVFALLARGKAAGATVIEMADALGTTRQHAHRLLRQDEVSASVTPSRSPSVSPSPSPKRRAKDDGSRR